LKEAFNFSNHLLNALETDKTSIAEGVYPIQDEPQFITIDFLQG
jgi:hypothetical protein